MDSNFIGFVTDSRVDNSMSLPQLSSNVNNHQISPWSNTIERVNQLIDFESFYHYSYSFEITDGINSRVDIRSDHEYLLGRCEEILRRLNIFESNNGNWRIILKYSITRIQTIFTYIMVEINEAREKILLAKLELFPDRVNLLDCFLDMFNSECVLWANKSNMMNGKIVSLKVVKKIPFISLFLRLPGSCSFFKEILKGYEFGNSIDVKDYALLEKISVLAGNLIKLIDQCGSSATAEPLLKNINDSCGPLFLMLKNMPRTPPSSTSVVYNPVKEPEEIKEVSDELPTDFFENILNDNVETEFDEDCHEVTRVSQDNDPAKPITPFIPLPTRNKNMYDALFKVSGRHLDMNDSRLLRAPKGYSFQLEISRDYSARTDKKDRDGDVSKSYYFLNEIQGEIVCLISADESGISKLEKIIKLYRPTGNVLLDSILLLNEQCRYGPRGTGRLSSFIRPLLFVSGSLCFFERLKREKLFISGKDELLKNPDLLQKYKNELKIFGDTLLDIIRVQRGREFIDAIKKCVCNFLYPAYNIGEQITKEAGWDRLDFGLRFTPATVRSKLLKLASETIRPPLSVRSRFIKIAPKTILPSVPVFEIDLRDAGGAGEAAPHSVKRRNEVLDLTTNKRRRHENERTIENATDLRGILNIGNSCYINSAIHFMSVLPDWQQRFNAIKNHSNVTNALHAVLEQLKTDTPSYEVMVGLRQALFLDGVYQPKKGKINEQEDSAPFIEHILSCMGELISAVRVRVANGTLPRFVPESLSMLQVPIIRNSLEGPLTAQYVCDRYFQSTEINDPENAWEVDGRFFSHYQEKLQLMWPPPRHILIHFKRFAYDNEKATKICDFIQLPEDKQIDLSSGFEPSMLEGKPALYKVIAALVHEGMNLGQGHYKTLVKGQNEWHRLSDLTVESVANPHVELEKAYMWVLEKVE